MKKMISILGAVALISIGCSQSIDYVEPIYVTSVKYEKLSCKEVKKEFPYYTNTSCEELKEKLVYISPAEYEKLSCKQLNEQFIKIDERLETESKIETEESVGMMIAVPFFFLTTAGVPLIAPKTDAVKEQDRLKKEAYQKKFEKHDFEVRRLKQAYKSLKDNAMKKSCSFTKDIRERK